jgi:hypothetical protein
VYLFLDDDASETSSPNTSWRNVFASGGGRLGLGMVVVLLGYVAI